jgi:hypothetical protein
MVNVFGNSVEKAPGCALYCSEVATPLVTVEETQYLPHLLAVVLDSQSLGKEFRCFWFRDRRQVKLLSGRRSIRKSLLRGGRLRRFT